MCGLIYGWVEGYRRRRMAKAAIVSAFFGAAVGAAAGLLLAPQSGEETREDIGYAIQDTLDSAKDQIHKVGQSAKQVTDDLASSFQGNRSHNKREDYSKGYAAGFRAALDELSDEWDNIEATFGHGAEDDDRLLESDPFGLADEPNASRRNRRDSRGFQKERSNREHRSHELQAMRQKEAERRQEIGRPDKAKDAARPSTDSSDRAKESPAHAQGKLEVKVQDAKPISKDIKAEAQKAEEVKAEEAKENSSKGKDKK